MYWSNKPKKNSFHELACPETWPKNLNLGAWINYWYPKICSLLKINPEKDFEVVRWVEENYSPTIEFSTFEKKWQEQNALVIAPSNPIIPAEIRRSLKKHYLIIASEPVIGFLYVNGIIPHIIETDLDSNFSDLIRSAKKGSILAIHVHGDNKERIQAFFEIPETKKIDFFFTTQTRPTRKVVNTLGFTDGDRGVFLASHLGSKQIFLSGFELDTEPVTKQIQLSDYNEWIVRKKIKLEIAKTLICWLSLFHPLIDLNKKTRWLKTCNILQ